MRATMIGLDIAKRKMYFVGADAQGRIVFRKSCASSDLLDLLKQFPAPTLAMEACGGSSYWARQIQKLGFEVKLVSPIKVARQRLSQKNDYNDCITIIEVARHPDVQNTIFEQHQKATFGTRQLNERVHDVFEHRLQVERRADQAADLIDARQPLVLDRVFTIVDQARHRRLQRGHLLNEQLGIEFTALDLIEQARDRQLTVVQQVINFAGIAAR